MGVAVAANDVLRTGISAVSERPGHGSRLVLPAAGVDVGSPRLGTAGNVSSLAWASIAQVCDRPGEGVVVEQQAQIVNRESHRREGLRSAALRLG